MKKSLSCLVVLVLLALLLTAPALAAGGSPLSEHLLENIQAFVDYARDCAPLSDGARQRIEAMGQTYEDDAYIFTGDIDRDGYPLYGILVGKSASGAVDHDSSLVYHGVLSMIYETEEIDDLRTRSKLADELDRFFLANRQAGDEWSMELYDFQLYFEKPEPGPSSPAFILCFARTGSAVSTDTLLQQAREMGQQ